MAYTIVKKDFSIQDEDGKTDILMTKLVNAVKQTEIKGVAITLPRALKIAEQVKAVWEELGEIPPNKVQEILADNFTSVNQVIDATVEGQTEFFKQQANA